MRSRVAPTPPLHHARPQTRGERRHGTALEDRTPLRPMPNPDHRIITPPLTLPTPPSSHYPAPPHLHLRHPYPETTLTNRCRCPPLPQNPADLACRALCRTPRLPHSRGAPPTRSLTGLATVVRVVEHSSIAPQSKYREGAARLDQVVDARAVIAFAKKCARHPPPPTPDPPHNTTHHSSCLPTPRTTGRYPDPPTDGPPEVPSAGRTCTGPAASAASTTSRLPPPTPMIDSRPHPSPPSTRRPTRPSPLHPTTLPPPTTELVVRRRRRPPRRPPYSLLRLART